MEVENVQQSQQQSDDREETGPRSAHLSEQESKLNNPVTKMEEEDEDEVVSNHTQEVIAPSKSKFDQFKEDVKKRENEGRERIFTKVNVDKDCELKEVQVFEDYTVRLILQDTEYGSDTQDRYMKMQLLERNDAKKWFLWLATGKVGRDNQKKQVFSYSNKVDACAAFEKKFTANTDNRWTERDFFKPKTGKYIYVSAEKEKEKMQLAIKNQQELMSMLKKAKIIGREDEMTDVGESDEMHDLLKQVWNVDIYKQTLRDYSLDVDKMPPGVLNHDKVKKCNAILQAITKLLSVSKGNAADRESKLSNLTTDFYQTLPFDFGVKRPALIDHLIRVKEKARMLEVINDICITEQSLLNSMNDMKSDTNKTLQNELLANVKLLPRDDKVFE